MASIKDTVILTFNGQQITSTVSDIPLYQAIVTRVFINQPSESRLQNILDSLQAALDFGGFGMTIDIYSKNLFEALAIAKSTGCFPDISKIKKTTKSKPEEKPKLKRFDSGDFKPHSPTFLKRNSSSPLSSLVSRMDSPKVSSVKLGIKNFDESFHEDFVMWFEILPKMNEGHLVDSFMKECRENKILFKSYENVPIPKILVKNFLMEKIKKKRVYSALNPMKD